MNNTVKSIGYRSAILSLVFAAGYCVPQVLSALKLIPHPQDLFWLFFPSLFLSPAFLLTVICLHYSVTPSLKIWTAIASSFAILYCMAVTIVYFTQLTVVLPAQLKGEINQSHVLIFEPKTFLMAVDCLGYFFMSLSTLFAAFAFKNTSRWLYRGLLYNGLLLPVLVLAFFFPIFYYIGALWMISFPLAMVNALRFFKIKKEPAIGKLRTEFRKREIKNQMT